MQLHDLAAEQTVRAAESRRCEVACEDEPHQIGTLCFIAVIGPLEDRIGRVVEPWAVLVTDIHVVAMPGHGHPVVHPIPEAEFNGIALCDTVVKMQPRPWADRRRVVGQRVLTQTHETVRWHSEPIDQRGLRRVQPHPLDRVRVEVDRLVQIMPNLQGKVVGTDVVPTEKVGSDTRIT